MEMQILKGQTVLFQGDSITDWGRDYKDPNSLGTGYPLMIASRFGAMYPQLGVKFLNRGVSGNRVCQMRERWQEDCLNLRPDWVSVLIGINDTWRRFDGNDLITPAKDYERDLYACLYSAREQGARVIVLEPFVLPYTPEMAGAWREDLDPRIAAARRVARQVEALYVPLDGLFAQAERQAPSGYWTKEGVHPTCAGAGLIAQAWLEAVGAIRK